MYTVIKKHLHNRTEAEPFFYFQRVFHFVVLHPAMLFSNNAVVFNRRFPANLRNLYCSQWIGTSRITCHPRRPRRADSRDEGLNCTRVTQKGIICQALPVVCALSPGSQQDSLELGYCVPVHHDSLEWPGFHPTFSAWAPIPRCPCLACEEPQRRGVQVDILKPMD